MAWALVSMCLMQGFGARPAHHPSFPQGILSDESGRSWPAAQPSPQLRVIIFGYASCLRRCPLALRDLAALLNKLEPAARKKLAVHFVDVSGDPKAAPAAAHLARAFIADAHGLALRSEQAGEALSQHLQEVIAWSRPRQRGETSTDAAPVLVHPEVLLVLNPEGQEVLRLRWQDNLDLTLLELRATLAGGDGATRP